MSNDGATRAAPAARPDGCAGCPLRATACFAPASAEEIALIDQLKQSEQRFDAGEVLIAEGHHDSPLYTLLEGWAFRYKTLPDGRRQILNFMLPGDFIGLQQKLSDAAAHGVEALTAVRVCRFRRDAVWVLHREQPSLGYDLTWLSAHEQALLDDNLLSVGRRTALERTAALLLTLQHRAAPFEPTEDGARPPSGMRLPLTQQHLADALGLSLVHLQRTLRALTASGLVDWRSDRRLHLRDPAALARLAHLRWPLLQPLRPLL